MNAPAVWAAAARSNGPHIVFSGPVIGHDRLAGWGASELIIAPHAAVCVGANSLGVGLRLVSSRCHCHPPRVGDDMTSVWGGVMTLE